MILTLRTLLRASAAEAEERLVDDQAPRLMAQHLREAEADLRRARQGLATLVARARAETRRREEAEGEIARREGEARAALAGGDTRLAEDLAQRIADLEETVERTRKGEAALDTRVADLRHMVAEAERRMTALAHELRAARSGRLARGLGQRLAAGGIGTADALSALDQAEALAKRLDETGREADDRAEALRRAPQSTADDLDERVEAAGIDGLRGARRRAVMDRLRAGMTDDSKGEA